MRTIDWQDGAVMIVDQTALPRELRFLRLETADQVVAAIARLAVRGAPALGAAGALGMALACAAADRAAPRATAIPDAAARLRAARPTAVNLAHRVDRAMARVPEGPKAVLGEALALLAEDEAASAAMGHRGADLLASLAPTPARLLTHCNTGALATVSGGTALAVVRTLHERGLLREVLATETRPLLQGARLTAWELGEADIPYRLIVDAAAPSLLARGLADAVVVGADRITANGDVVNKVGTYPLALGATRAGVPFLVVAPESTLDDATPTGADVVIEDRGPREVVEVAGTPTAPRGAAALNPAFDVTPHDLVTAIVTETRTIHPTADEQLIRSASDGPCERWERRGKDRRDGLARPR